MTTLNNNNVREDAIFKDKVKRILLRNEGCGGLVNVLLDFNARDAAAVQEQSSSSTATTTTTGTKSSPSAAAAGLTYAQFLAFLGDYGVELTPFEQQYLCRAFDDHGSGAISAATFTRHLTGLNERRLKAVRTAWQTLEQKKKESGSETTVTREVLLNTYAAAAAGAGGAAGSKGSPSSSQAPPEGGNDATFAHTARSATSSKSSNLANTFSSAKRQQLKERYLASTTGRSATGNGDSGADDEVSYAEFVAYYASVSPQFGADEDFVAHVLKAWAADDATRPTLGETAREWGPDGDPLALDGPRYVQDALNRQLGVSSKSYNFSHMQREQPYVEPLPPLSRPDIMATTTQKTYVSYDQNALTLANPLSTRRGQTM